jgi:hypothetical protein
VARRGGASEFREWDARHRIDAPRVCMLELAAWRALEATELSHDPSRCSIASSRSGRRGSTGAHSRTSHAAEQFIGKLGEAMDLAGGSAVGEAGDGPEARSSCAGLGGMSSSTSA